MRLVSFLIVCVFAAASPGQARLGDVVNVDGVEDNFLSGIGLIVGLDGTGDGDGVARRMAASILARRDINVSPNEINAENIALVEVQATLPPFKKPGDRIDVYVSSMGGKAKSLFGGRLVEMHLKGPGTSEVYALAQGAVVAGVAAQGASGSREKIGHPTTGVISDGAIVVREVPQRMVAKDGVMRLKLRQSSYATASNLADVVNSRHAGSARAVDAQTIEIKVPRSRRDDPVGLLNELGRLTVKIEPPARVIIDGNTGTITVGGDVVLLPGAVAHGSLSVSIQESTQVSQPNALAGGTTQAAPSSSVRIDQGGTEIRPLAAATSAADVARALNTLGLAPRELVAVFQSLKANGLLTAELKIL